MPAPVRPRVRLLDDDTARDVVAEAKRILDEVGVFVEYERAKELLHGAGARIGDDGRVRIAPEMVDKALAAAPPEVQIFDRDGAHPCRIGGDETHFDPGSAAIKVYDRAAREVRPATTADCALFARLTERLPALSMQSTCVVPADVPREAADRVRLSLAVRHCKKAVVTGTFGLESFERMRAMLACVRGSEAALRQKPLAIFDCCPSPPLKWSELTCADLVRCAEAGIPAELVSMPLTGATSPVTLLGAITQHAAESLSGVVIHQLAGLGAPIIYGGSPAAFDMRRGTTPMGAVETMMIDMAYAQVGKHLGLPTHAYMALSDAKTPDYQAGMETGIGAVLAALAGINVVSGPGMLDFESCQSLEKLVLDHEACAMALRLTRGVERREAVMALGVIAPGVAAEQFLNLDHTRQWYRKEHLLAGPVVDRDVGDVWAAKGKQTALDRAHAEVERLLAREDAPPLDGAVLAELDRLAKADA